MRTRQDLLDALKWRLLRNGRQRWVVVAGIDRFTRLRSAIGFDRADGFVAELGARMEAAFEDSLVARLAPDAIGCLVDAQEELTSDQLAFVRAELERPLKLSGGLLRAPVRLGYAQQEPTRTRAEDTLHQAELALDQAREAGAAIEMFSPGAYGDPASRLAMLNDLHRALRQGEVELHYQPQVRTRSGEVASAEALLRWTCPKRGAVPPVDFIPMAEETGFIAELSEWVVRRAIADGAALKAGGCSLPVSVNMSTGLLCDAGFVGHVLDLLASAPTEIALEITETAAVFDWPRAQENLKRLSNAGVRIAIDDYGSGMSSLAYLQQIPANELKIDKQFITQITRANRDPLLVRSTIELGHALELDVVCEGIEDAASLALLTVMGCDLAQGYYLGRPMRLADLQTYLAAEPTREVITRPLERRLLWNE
jgi:diguanylate cyclase